MAGDIAVEREDRELHEKVAMERAGVPNTIDGFRHA